MLYKEFAAFGDGRKGVTVAPDIGGHCRGGSSSAKPAFVTVAVITTIVTVR
jgi:hypothetical protein